MQTPYDDIIYLPHHVSRNHPQMPLRDRAAQFAPFAALTGYESAVGETARLTSERRELDPQDAEELNRRLTELAARLPDHPEVTVEYFVPDDRKAGGAYVTVTGRVRHVSVPEQTLVMEDGTEIPMEDIVSMTGEIFCRI
ncbi:MAG: YolD-like family protein [Lentisphaerae bacterium]|nr:YolD-like family protein [Lentisphaerota bacterium]